MKLSRNNMENDKWKEEKNKGIKKMDMEYCLHLVKP